jgi:hypothetical protein
LEIARNPDNFTFQKYYDNVFFKKQLNTCASINDNNCEPGTDGILENHGYLREQNSQLTTPVT